MAKQRVSKPARTSPPVRVSYAEQIFVAKAGEKGGALKYGVTILVDKKNAEQMAWLKQIATDATEALAEYWPDPATRPRIPVIGELASVIKDGDKTCNKQGIPYKEKNPEYIGNYFLRVYNTTKPTAVDRNNSAIIDPSEIYSGCYCRVNINCYTFDGETNKGVTAGLNGVQKWAEGERLSGGAPSLEAMFGGAVPAEADPFANADPFAGAATNVDDALKM